MKKAKLSYHKEFPQTPVSGYAGARWYGWVNHQNENGQWKRPKFENHPFLKQRNLWCLLELHFKGIDLIFAMPEELDQFILVMSQNPLPSGHSLVKGHRLGRPNSHWLSRLPKKAKPWPFRQKLCEYVSTCPEALEFREFYETTPIRFDFEGYHESFHEALSAQNNQ